MSDANTLDAVRAAGGPIVQGIAVPGATGGARFYSEQVAESGRRHLKGADGLYRIAELGEKIIESAPVTGLPLSAEEAAELARLPASALAVANSSATPGLRRHPSR